MNKENPAAPPPAPLSGYDACDHTPNPPAAPSCPILPLVDTRRRHRIKPMRSMVVAGLLFLPTGRIYEGLGPWCHATSCVGDGSRGERQGGEPDGRKKILSICFEAMPGMKINFTKTEAFTLGAKQKEGTCIANLFNCQRAKFPISYLGLPCSDKYCWRRTGIPRSAKSLSELILGKEN